MGPDDAVVVVAVRGSFWSGNWHRVSGLRPRLRVDIEVRRSRFRGELWYVVQDNLTGRQHRFTPAAYLVLALLDGERTVEEAWHLVCERLDAEAPSQDAVVSLLAELYAADLMSSEIPRPVAGLLERHDRQARAELWQRYGNLLSLRIPLLDPDRFLTATAHLARPLFGAFGAAIWLAVVCSGLVVAAMRWSDLTTGFVDRVMANENLFAMALVYPVTKLIHELAHAYAVKRWGGDVREFGFSFLLLLPMPYVDASAATLFRDKWPRIVVGAAGMAAELVVAAMAVILWSVSEPGWVRSVAYAATLSAGFGTLVFNANPLLRLDGYYILSDWLEIPNLAQRSSLQWRRLAERLLFGLPGRAAGPEPRLAERVWLLLYAPLSLCYRGYVSVQIGALIAARFFYAGLAIVVWRLGQLTLWPMLKAAAHILTAPVLSGRRIRAVAAAGGAAGLCAAFLLLVPLPLRSSAEGVVWLPDNSVVRAPESGFVKAVVGRPGQSIREGADLVRLTDPELEHALPVARAKIAALESRIMALQFGDLSQADILRQELQVRRNDLARLQERLDHLTVRSPREGLFVLPKAEDLASRYLKRGDLIGYVTPEDSRIVRVAVPQATAELVRADLVRAEMKVPGRSGVALEARLVREVPAGSQRLPSPALGDAGGGRVASDPRDSKRLSSLKRTFQFDLECPADASLSDFGERVVVRFDHGREPLGFQLYRSIRMILLSRFDA